MNTHKIQVILATTSDCVGDAGVTGTSFTEEILTRVGKDILKSSEQEKRSWKRWWSASMRCANLHISSSYSLWDSLPSRRPLTNFSSSGSIIEFRMTSSMKLAGGDVQSTMSCGIQGQSLQVYCGLQYKAHPMGISGSIYHWQYIWTLH